MKVILSRCRHAALGFFLGLEVEESQIVELPQETASVRTSDFPLWVRTRDGKVFIVLLEVQTRWEADVPLRLLEYDVRHRLKTGLSVLPVVMVLTPGGDISECFEDGGIRYRWRVLSLAAMDARSVLDSKNPCLMPFVGLMRGGTDLLDQAEQILYDSPLERSDKADLLTGMALLSGLVSTDLPRRLLQRRRDIMRESAAYELIKKEGFEEGLQKGIQQGIEQGIERGVEQGLRRGMVQSARRLIAAALEARFETVPRSVFVLLQEINDPDTLEMLHKVALRADSIETFKQKAQLMVEH